MRGGRFAGVPRQDIAVVGHIHGVMGRHWLEGDVEIGGGGVFIVQIRGLVIGIIRPHKDIPNVIVLPVEDVHRVFTVLKRFGMPLGVVSPAPCPVPG